MGFDSYMLSAEDQVSVQKLLLDSTESVLSESQQRGRMLEGLRSVEMNMKWGPQPDPFIPLEEVPDKKFTAVQYPILMDASLEYQLVRRAAAVRISSGHEHHDKAYAGHISAALSDVAKSALVAVHRIVARIRFRKQLVDGFVE